MKNNAAITLKYWLAAIYYIFSFEFITALTKKK